MARGQQRSNGNRRVSRSSRAGLVFPVGRVQRNLRSLDARSRISAAAPVYLAAVLEYITAEVLELAGKESTDAKKRRITPRFIQLAIRRDAELNQLMAGAVIPEGGVLPSINPVLLEKSKKTKIVKVQKKKGTKVKRSTKAAAPIPMRQGFSQPASHGEISQTSVLHQKKVGGILLKVVQGDICDIATDAIVHPTNSTLSLAGGVGSAISRVAGGGLSREISQWNSENDSLSVSECCVTSGHGLRSRNVIHVHSPQWGNSDSRDNLGESVMNIFQLAEKHKFSSIAFPSIGSGANSFPKHTAAAIILRAIQCYSETSKKSSIRNVVFVLFDQTSVAVYKHELINM
eukprot:68505_1